jgi:5-methylcytosine-specific restriction endonuclease McrBC GTP-binding regulatory subunit McrB
VSGTKRHVLIAVRSDWADPRGLVGFFNPLTDAYVRTAVIDLLLQAAEDPGSPYLVILDEMNLARVEYYFSDFLSALESDEPIELMPPATEEELLALGHDDVPARLRIPPNVSFLATVNVDETTQSFSPKVLDRANVIEFSEVDVERALGHPVDTPIEGLRLKDGQLNPAWLCTTRDQALAAAGVAHDNESFTEALEDVHDLLARFHLQFGYRVIAEVSAFVGHALQKVAGDTELVVERAFDLQLQQKVVPKLTGGGELEQPLAHLLQYCHGAKTTEVDLEAVRSAARAALDPTNMTGVEPPRYPGSARKILRMLDRLAGTGFVGALE